MTYLFSFILSMSRMGSIVILAVLFIRLCFRRAPRCISYALWIVVLFRLLCPVSLSVQRAPIALAEPILTDISPMTSAVTPIFYPSANVPSVSASENSIMDILSWVWFGGTVLFLLLTLFSLLKLHIRLRDAIRLEKGVYWSDKIDVPFTFGRTIYLPSHLSSQEQTYILMHERYHLHRGDPLWKLLGLLALTLHWFNPLCWICFHLAEKDMEMSCDEAVMNQLDYDARQAYSTLLLDLSVGRPGVSVVLSFGEVNPGKRIRNILRWKRPSTGLLLGCTVTVTIFTVLLAVNPGSTPVRAEEQLTTTEEIPLLHLLKNGVVVSAEGKNLPKLSVIQALLHDTFRSPKLTDAQDMDTVWSITADIRLKPDLPTETVQLRCGLTCPDVVELFIEDMPPIAVQSRSLYELVQSARDPTDYRDDRIPYVDDPQAYGRFHDLVSAFVSMDLGTNGIHTKSTLTHFLAVQTGPHPLGMEVYFVGTYTEADPLERTAELLTGDAYADSRLRIYEREKRQCLVAVNQKPIGFVSGDWLRQNQNTYTSQQELIQAVLEQGLPASNFLQ